MSDSYEAAAEIRDAIIGLDDEDRALADISKSLRRIAKALETIAEVSLLTNGIKPKEPS